MKSDIDTVRKQLKQGGYLFPEGRVELAEYGDSPELEAELIALIRSGAKRATSSLVWSYEAEDSNLPQVGDYEIIIDGVGQPILLTRIVSIAMLPFSAMTEEQARCEGEGDLSLDHWRQGHWAFFTRECERIGREASLEMPIIYTEFEVVEVYQSCS